MYAIGRSPNFGSDSLGGLCKFHHNLLPTMKTVFLTALCALTCLVARAQTTFTNYTLNQFSSGVASLNLTVPGNTLLRVLNQQSLYVKGTGATIKYVNSPTMNFSLTDKLPALGPCTLSLYATGSVSSTITFMVQYETVNLSTYQSSFVQPAGAAATITLQSSTNLTTWTTATNGSYPPSDNNRFFRMALTVN